MQNMSCSISSSVGLKGNNYSADVIVIQNLLNKFAGQAGYPPLKLDGRIGKRTIAAISLFQKKIIKLKIVDGRVDPSGRSLRKLNQPLKPSQKESEPKMAGGVSGDVRGVNVNIIKYLKAVASHYQTNIVVTSGKRTPVRQARAMWNNWDKHLNQGSIYKYLRKRRILRKELNKLFKAKSRNEFNQKVLPVARFLSSHVSGRAVDVTLTTNKKVLAAIKAGLRYVKETHKGKIKCHHFEISKGKQAQISKEVTKLWPAR